MVLRHVSIASAVAAALRVSCAAAATLILHACDRGDGPAPEPAPAPDAAAEAETRRLGPFTVGGASWEVVLGVLHHGGEETVHHLRIVDANGVLQHEAEFGTPEPTDWGFAETVVVHGWTVTGASGNGLMIRQEHLPSAPMTGTSYQLFGRRGDHLVPLAPPLAWYGEYTAPRPEGRPPSARLPAGDLLTVLLWRYHFGAVLPLRLDFGCQPGSDTCIVPAATALPGAAGFSRMDVQVDLRRPEGQQFITLLAVPGDERGATVAVHADSRVEIVEVAARVGLRVAENTEIVVQDEHLRIRIDGREGWIRGPEDFEAVGLPAAG